MDAEGRYIYVADTNGHLLRRIDLLDDSNGVVTIAGKFGEAGWWTSARD